ncbi:uncharacterized protein FIBRA_03215 [Fibroporia radiculosa]|uniref:Uncharacterized protein n=1 Tax=Fibroporia radiculosa TaxID=599839 RepID=J4HVV4_9APHY|nr:uncharacterized protein FIBRA_03215 [Fibroporia radiculosa]CCM01167.1 predicted protein [Fibroporia radiculosa]
MASVDISYLPNGYDDWHKALLQALCHRMNDEGSQTRTARRLSSSWISSLSVNRCFLISLSLHFLSGYVYPRLRFQTTEIAQEPEDEMASIVSPLPRSSVSFPSSLRPLSCSKTRLSSSPSSNNDDDRAMTNARWPLSSTRISLDEHLRFALPPPLCLSHPLFFTLAL